MRAQRKYRAAPRRLIGKALNKQLDKRTGKQSDKEIGKDLGKELSSELAELTIDSFSSLDSLQKLAKYGQIIEASATGILIKFRREDFVSKDLRSNLNIDQLVGKNIYFNIHEMDLEISGRVARTKFLGKDGFVVAVDYREDAPEYWRECLMDLLPTG